MIVIERTWKEPDPRGGGRLSKVTRKVFTDDDLDGVNEFINETTEISGYEWTDVEYKYIKL